MSDFLSALARRAIMPAAVRPRIASRFEDGIGAAGLRELHERVEPMPAEPTVRADVTSSVPLRDKSATDTAINRVLARPAPETLRVVTVKPADDPVNQPTPQRPQPVEVPAPVWSPAPAHAPAAAASVAATTDPSRESQLQWAQAAPPTAATPTPTSVEHLTRHERIEHETLRTRIESRIVERLTLEPSQAAGSRSSVAPVIALKPSAPPAAPRIEIHIGRIEVQSSTPSVTEARHADIPQPLPAQSLDAYLGERNDSSRLRRRTS